MWPTNHEDKMTLKEKGEIRKLPIVSWYWRQTLKCDKKIDVHKNFPPMD